MLRAARCVVCVSSCAFREASFELRLRVAAVCRRPVQLSLLLDQSPVAEMSLEGHAVVEVELPSVRAAALHQLIFRVVDPLVTPDSPRLAVGFEWIEIVDAGSAQRVPLHEGNRGE